MSRNYLYLFCVVLAGLVFIGCGGGSSDVIKSIDIPEITTTQSVNSDGTIDITNVLGLRLIADKKNTFNPDVSVQIKRKDTVERESKYFNNASRLYTISAEKPYIDALGVERTAKVTDVKEPILLRIQNTSTVKNGTYYAAFRTNKNQEWKYSILNIGNSKSNPMTLSARFSQNNYQSEYYIETCDVDMQVMLFVLPSETTLNKTVISDFALNDAKPIQIESDSDSYLEDLKLKINLAGDNLSKLKPANVTVSISFFNNDSTKYPATTIPITGATCETSVSSKDAGAGNSYVHTMTLSNITDFSASQLSFGLGLKNISKTLFPTAFNITLNVKDTEDTLSYECTKVVNIDTGTDDKNVTATMVQPEVGAEGVATNTPIILTFSGEIKWSKEAESKITVGAASETISCNYAYSNKKLTITHNGLSSNRIYTVKIDKGLEAVASNTFVAPNSFCFMTGGNSDLNLINIVSTSPKNGDTDVATNSSSVITVTFDADVAADTAWNNYVFLTQGANKLPLTFDYSDKVLTIHHENLLNNIAYTVFVDGGMKGTDPQSETASKMFGFTTSKHEVTPSITGSDLKSSDNKYYLVAGQKFTINFNKPILTPDSARASITMKKGYEDFKDFTIGEITANSQIATVTVNSLLEPSTDYTIVIAEFTETDNSVIKTASQVFSTLPDILLNSVKVASGSEWVDIGNRNDVATSGRIIAAFNLPVEPSAVKIVDEAGTEITEGVTVVTTEKSTNIELEYNNLKFVNSYAVSIAYTDSITGQKVATQKIAFKTSTSDLPFLENPNAENSPENPYLIYTAAALDNVRNDLTGHYKQMVDIDLYDYISETCTETEGWAPIATSTAFSGSFNGNGYKISNMNISRNVSYTGLFGKVSGSLTGITLVRPILTTSSYCGNLAGECLSGSRIKDCSIENCILNSNGYYVGGLVGKTNNDTIIENSKVKLDLLKATTPFGGFVGIATGTEFTDCSSYVKGNISLSTDGYNCGGFAGSVSNSKLTNCDSSANISYDNYYYYGSSSRMGILVAECSSTNLTNCHASGNISVYGDCYESNFGVLAGYISGNSNISECSATGNIISYTYYSCLGLLIGYDDSTGIISGCTASGTLEFSNEIRGIGGLIGYCCNGNVENCKASSNISGYAYSYEAGVGGLIGYCGNSVNVTNCSSTGEVRCGGSNGNTGGLIGYLYSTGNISECTSECAVSSSEYESRAGGLIGYVSNGNVNDCSASGTVLCEYDSNCKGGGLIGENNGTVSGCTAYGIIRTFTSGGGLIGRNGGTVNNCKAFCSIDNVSYCGGLIGNNSGNLTGCLASGTLSGNNVGGLIGSCEYGNITECEAFGVITPQNDYGSLGGLIGCDGEYGYGEYSVNKSTAKVSIRGNGSNVGGLIGNSSYATLSECSADCDIDIGRADNIGGLIGNSGGYYGSYGSATLRKCSAKGSIKVSASSSNIGGLIGIAYNIDIFECFADCNFQLDSTGYIGGLLGYSYQEMGMSSSLSNNYTKCIFNAASNNKSGGLIGYASVMDDSTLNIANCYSTCALNTNGNEIGGLIGNLNVYYYDDGTYIWEGHFSMEKSFTTDMTHNIVGNEASSDTRGTCYRSAAGYNSSLAWDEAIWTGLDTGTPTLINNQPQSI